MQRTSIPIFVAIILVASICATIYFTRDTASSVVSPRASDGSYTIATIAEHADPGSCWTIIEGNVYDLTEWIPLHPGGRAAILSLCGTDGSAAFNKQHGSGRMQQEILAEFKIGTLIQ